MLQRQQLGMDSTTGKHRPVDGYDANNSLLLADRATVGSSERGGGSDATNRLEVSAAGRVDPSGEEACGTIGNPADSSPIEISSREHYIAGNLGEDLRAACVLTRRMSWSSPWILIEE